MDDTVSGLWKRCEKLEAERDELQRKLDIAVEALRWISRGNHPGNWRERKMADDALTKIEKLEEK